MHEDGLTAVGHPARNRAPGDVARRLADKFLLKSLNEDLQRRSAGALQLVLPSGANAVFGHFDGVCDARLTINRYRALWKFIRGGALGLAESYMDGDLDTNDMKAVFNFYVANEQALTAALPSIGATRRRDRFVHQRRCNTRAGSRRNIAAHYDLGNDFYRCWLDDSMLYSSGIFSRPEATLEDAQREKLDRILAALELHPSQALLEIGCGWGALAEAAARRGAHVDAITISQQQLAAARDRIERAGLQEHASIRFEDYRDTTGAYDRLVSIEMIEAVGEENWRLYFETIAARLKADGVAVIQAITIRDDAFERYRANPDFIQRYIFPGGMLPTVPLMRDHAVAAGLTFETVEQFGSSYAQTLRIWRRRFEAAWPDIAALGFDDRFRRMWLYYLTYCEVGFERGLIDVGLYRMRKSA